MWSNRVVGALTPLTRHVYSWSRVHGIPPKTYPWNSHAVRLGDEGRIALIDPLPLELPEEEGIEALGHPELVRLTTAWHERAADAARLRWGCRVLVFKSGDTEVEKPVDGVFDDGERFGQRLRAIHLPGGYHRDETAFLVESEEPVLILGDILCGPREDCGIPPGEVGVFPAAAIAGRDRSHEVYARLLELEWDALVFAHGAPIPSGARAALRRYMNR